MFDAILHAVELIGFAALAWWLIGAWVVTRYYWAADFP